MSPAAFAAHVTRLILDWYGFASIHVNRKGHRGSRAMSEARAVAWHAIRSRGVYSYEEIGARFNADHTSVMHGVARVNRTPALLAMSKRFSRDVLSAREPEAAE